MRNDFEQRNTFVGDTKKEAAQWMEKDEELLEGMDTTNIEEGGSRNLPAQGYAIRRATLKDTGAIIGLHRGWLPSEIAVAESCVKVCIQRFPEGQLVAEKKGRIVAAVLTQLIGSVDELYGKAFDETLDMHDERGSVLHILWWNVLPEYQDQLSDVLIEDVLDQASCRSRVRFVAGVARCAAYARDGKMTFEKYVTTTENGLVIDPALRFHHSRGGRLVGIIENHQPLDRENRGYGVLYEYDLEQRRQKKSAALTRQGSRAAIAKDVAASVMGYLNSKFVLVKEDQEKMLTELGLEQKDFAELYARIQKNADIELPFQYLQQMKLADLHQILGVDAHVNPPRVVDSPLHSRIRGLMRRYPEIVPLAIDGVGVCTFWIHPMSGDVGVYKKLATKVGNVLRMIGINARGFLSVDVKPLSNMKAIAKYYAEVITAVDPIGPYHLTGFSVGGTIAYEVACQLQLQGKSVASLILVEAPLLTKEDLPLFQTSVRNNLLVNANFLLVTLLSMNPEFKRSLKNGGISWKEMQIKDEDIAVVGDDQLLDRLVELCEQKGVKLSRVELAFKLKSMADVHLANLHATQSYQAAPLPRAAEIKAFLFRTRNGQVSSSVLRNPEYVERVQEAYGSLLSLLTQWDSLLPDLTTVILDGEDHFDILRSEQGTKKFIAHCMNIFSAPSVSQEYTQLATTTSQGEPVAIIGMSGRFPGAQNVQQFWGNLRDSISSVTEAPTDRGWHIHDYFDAVPQTPGKSYSKWGGFLSDVDKFDPLFFGMSPREAELMDPSERIFLQECWKAIEDAGYSATEISGKPWGVFATAKGDYSYHIHKQHETYLHPTDSSAPSRVSYFLNLIGPAVSIDTACSSTLTAVTYACDSLVLGNCEVALAGGGGIYSTPNFFVTSSQSLLFSPDGKCSPFDHRANGTVMAEAVGVVVLKLLKNALRDGDHIYGVVRGWATNQDGKTNGMTAPSAYSQTRLQTGVYQKFGIDPAQITMVESHGTGTKLGDPIEVQALTASFREFTQKVGYCALTAVKGNIGHAFAGSGITALIKVLLSLKHQKIPPNLNYEKNNPIIRMDGSPFFINASLRDWDSNGAARCAAINSFGATGINAHVVVEEFVWQNRQAGNTRESGPVIILLSAKSAEILTEQVKNLLASVQLDRCAGATLEQVAYTLQIGRVAMEHRLALLATSFDELELKLIAFLDGKKQVENLYLGQIAKGQILDDLLGHKELHDLAAAWIERKEYLKLLRLWVNGIELDWRQLYGQAKPHRVSLPTYPFAKERYWYASPSGQSENNKSVIAWQNSRMIHPLLHTNTSDLAEQKYSSIFTGNEFFLADHVVNGSPVLPGVAYLEMARAALENATKANSDGLGICIKNVIWARPITIDAEALEVQIALTPQDGVELAYEIFTEDTVHIGARIVHSRGYAQLAEFAPDQWHDIPALVEECHVRQLTRDECYEIFRAVGIDYGSGHRGIKRLLVGKGKALAELIMPDDMTDTLEQFVFHPGLADSALQACIGLLFGTTDDNHQKKPPKLFLPFALRGLEIRGRCTQMMWALVRHSHEHDDGEQIEMDIDLCDQDGCVQARLKGLAARVYAGEPDAASIAGTLMLSPEWRKREIAQVATPLHYERHTVLLINLNVGSMVKELLPETKCYSLQSGKQDIHQDFEYYALEALLIIQDILRNKNDGRTLIQIVIPYMEEKSLLSGLLGLLNTAQLENPKIIGQLIGVDEHDDCGTLIERIKENLAAPLERYVRYVHQQRYVLSWKEIADISHAAQLPWKNGGVYLLTGGAGGIGLRLAKEIALHFKDAVLVLAGRSQLSDQQQRAMDEIVTSGGRVTYKQADIAVASSAANLLAEICAEFGKVTGIVHLAGVVRDNFIIKKTSDELREVMSPKVAGLVNLDQASKDDTLEFFVLFSSLAGVTGNTGQADYSMANAFMDEYARYRNVLVRMGQRHGHTVSVNWPLWLEGGIHPKAAHQASLELGLTPIAWEAACSAFYQALATGCEQVVIMHGEIAKIRGQIQTTVSTTVTASIPPKQSGQRDVEKRKPIYPLAREGGACLPDKTVEFLKKQLSSTLKLPEHKIDPDAQLEKYGIDSIVAMELTMVLEKTFGQLPKTLFFEYHNIRDLADYFVNQYNEKLTALLLPQITAPTVTVRPAANKKVSVKHHEANTIKSRFPRKQDKPAHMLMEEARDIAIIGLAGRYPKSNNLDELWANLKNGVDCVTEVPASRWDNHSYFDPSFHSVGKTYCKWGGFIDDVDRFDPLFFNISPREAAFVDPQERLFLETVWETLEGAGYTRKTLTDKYAGQVGVYVGAMYQQYQAVESDLNTEAVLSLASYSSIANRVSYFLDLHGPSIALDTMCSSSFSAIHMACESLLKRDCQLAIAGGVNLSIHPKKYIGLSLARIIGSDLNSRSFAHGDGYLPAEGVGAVLLKPLHQAILDGDIIWGVIKASSVNHGGHTHGFGVPNPNAQAQLIESNFAKSGIDPQTISYIEAAANGSPLGDPIEISALSKVFGKYANKGVTCPIGSVKSNIGHAEAASGMSQLAKVILQMRHRKIAPSIKVDNVNPNIHFEASPFFLQKELCDWDRPVVEIDGVKQEVPRRAMINAFGAGGSNAHLIVEEYQPALRELRQSDTVDMKQIVVLSAKTTERLRLAVQRLQIFLENHDELALDNIAYTLQIGRETMECRLALVVRSREELRRGLAQYLLSGIDGELSAASVPIYIGQSNDVQSLCELFFGSVGESMVAALMADRNPEKLALYWVHGGAIEWEQLHLGLDVRRVHVPTYPFERKRCWVDTRDRDDIKTAQPQGGLPVEHSVAGMVASLIGVTVEELSPTKSLHDFGFDSIQRMHLLAQLQTTIDPAINAEDLAECRTLQDITALLSTSNYLESRRNGLPLSSRSLEVWPQFPELIRLNRYSQGRPVFWFHAGMGGVEAYQAIAQKSARPFFGIQARGWGTEREPLHGIQAMATYYVHIICSVWPDGPYDLGGYSLGGLLAYEVTRQLQELDKTVNTIVMLDSPDGHSLRSTAISPKTDMLRAINTQLSSLVRGHSNDLATILIHRDEVGSCDSDREFLVALMDIARQRGLTRSEMKWGDQITQQIRVQSAYQLHQTTLLPLSTPDEVCCYYFRNRSGVFLGALEPYFLAKDDGIGIEAEVYWQEWTTLLTRLEMVDVEASNHLSLLTEVPAFQQISAFCEMLYSEESQRDKLISAQVETTSVTS